ncbi:MAG: protease HtpX [Bdellovibrionaceae bacterium]|nr:protease HtpX [Pseudobdellovibrionaceae bacterium]MDW8190300.1 protease HtpX [Pseudobdellovibrionaceae bacterium]
MAIAKRVFLFILTNIAVILTINIALNLISMFLGVSLDPASYSGLILFASVWGMGGAFISLWLSKWMAKMAMGVQVISPSTRNPHEREILEMVYQIAKRAGLEKMPEVGIYDSPEINAFATGPSRNNALVALSTGLLHHMNRDEVEGVIGHEVAHIANGDMVTMTLIQGVVNAFVMFFSRLLARVIAANANENSRHVVYLGLTILFDLLFGLLGSMVVAYFSRVREYRADKGGARYAGRQKMIAGLRRLQSVFDSLEPDDSSVATLKISSRPSGILALFSTHPPLEERIRRLEMEVI